MSRCVSRDRASTVIALALLATLGTTGSASACGPAIAQPAFWYSYSPDDRERFFAGQLGVLGQELTEPYLYVAYRHLAGPGLDEISRASVSEFWKVPDPSPWKYDAVRLWNDAVREIAAGRPSSRHWPPQVLLTRPDGGYAGYFINCLEDAFRTAAETLRARADSRRADAYRPGSQELADWIAAQQIVFGNCGAEAGSIPEPLHDSASPLARTDRAYQIAAAHFYARDFELAAERFREIAADRSSPWSDISAYLEARCLVRSSTIGFLPRQELFTSAREVLDRILADPTRMAVHLASRRLRAFIDIRLDPAGTRARLRRRLMADRLEPPLRQDMIDYFWLLRRTQRDEIEGQDDLDRWILVFRRHHDPDAARRAARLWEAQTRAPRERAPDGEDGETAVDGTESELYLAAGLVLASRPEPWTRQMMEAAERIPVDSPLFPTVRYHLGRLQSEAGQYEAARTGLAQALAELGDRLSQGDRNRFAGLLAELAPTLDERITLGQQLPLAYTSMHEGTGDHPLASAPPLLQTFAGRTLPNDAAVDALNLASSAHLLSLLSDDSLEPTLRRRLAPIAWTRAVLLGDEEEALALEPLAVKAAPESAAELEAYRRAASGEERLFVASLGILRLPGLRPTVRHGFGRYGVGSYWEVEEPAGLDAFSFLRDNWWCHDPLHGIGPRTLAALSAKDRAEAERTITRLKEMPPAPTHLGYIILAWAETHRDDPRVPEALHRVVRGSRVCGGGEISRVAFQTLHRRYPGSVWAKKTKYWYK